VLIERQKLQIELEKVSAKLDKQRTKRTIIMSLINSVVSYFVLAWINGSFPDGLKAVLINALISIILGFAAYVFHVSCFSVVTDLFTNIRALESRVKDLDEKIKMMK
jgi:hypothetical protein